MPIDGATAIAYTGAFVGLVGGGVALFNARKAVCWKRAELANNYRRISLVPVSRHWTPISAASSG